ncbi:MAG: cyclase family protein [Hyellaceae cyanobacterium CSU_1_1]|nr:cyclase family protein [Hyellaceae cyanobacterium CSU_1_1]
MPQSNDWIDISLTIHPEMPYWPDNPAITIEPSQCLAHGDVCNVSKMTIGTHTGTHIDGINHFIKGGIGIDQMPLDATIGRARVIEIKDPHQVKVEELEPHNIKPGERILFKTRNSDFALKSDTFVEDFVHISTEAARYLAEKKVRTVGVDYLSIGGYKGNAIEVHYVLLGSGIWAIEGLNLNLAEVEPGEYELICLPIKLKDGNGGLARAILHPI